MAEEGDGEEKMTVAGAEEEEMDGGWGDGGAGGGYQVAMSDGQFLPPPGFRFTPTDDEMIRYYLLPKLQGREYVPNRGIIEDSVYQCHPDELTCKYWDRGQAKNWYFLSPRERKYKNGERPRRDTKDLRGRWKASTGKKNKGGGDDDDDLKKEKVAGDGTTKYCVSGLAYFWKAKDQGKEKKSKWLMEELTVPEYEIKLPKDGGPGGKTLDRYAMYKIYLTPKEKGNDYEEAGPSNADPVESDDEGETAELPKLSEKQAGKRPVEDQQLRSAAAKKKRAHRSSKCLQIEPPAPPPQGNGMQAPFGMLEYHGGSGQPMEEHLRMQIEIHAPQPQQRQMACTQQQQQQQQVMVFTQEQQQTMAFMMRQQEQEQWRMAFMMQQQQQYLDGANANCHHHAGGKAPQFSLDDFYASVAAEHYRRSRAVLPATSGSPGEAAPEKAEGSPVSTVVSAGGSGDSNNGNHDPAESAAAKASPGGSASAEGEMAPNIVRLSDRCSNF